MKAEGIFTIIGASLVFVICTYAFIWLVTPLSIEDIQERQARCAAAGRVFKINHAGVTGECVDNDYLINKCIQEASHIVKNAYNNPDIITNPDEVTKNAAEIVRTCYELHGNNK